ncbi:hypothetical protein AB0K66_21785 [Streptomyces werraensis]|uniref:hypothetical protein n=1 Tax=Streptomyces werraensis TaxID=68284 RepID=UPI0034301D5C
MSSSSAWSGGLTSSGPSKALNDVAVTFLRCSTGCSSPGPWTSTAASSRGARPRTKRPGAGTFTDVFLPARTGAGWRIANQVYHRHT